jgi:hypothetical protein
MKKGGNMAEKKKMSKIVWAIIAIGILWAIGNYKKDETSSGSTTVAKNNPASNSSDQIEQVGYFKSDRLRGFTCYVKNPTKRGIKAYCEKMKKQYQGLKNRILQIHFFDNRANTPDVTLKYYFPRSSNKYLVADYTHNPFNNHEGLGFHKNIK